MNRQPFRNASRRAILQAMAAGLVFPLAGSPSIAAARLRVQPVDRLALQILVDNSTFGPFLPDRSLPGLRVERARSGGPRMPRTPLMAEFGLSILAESTSGPDIRRVIVDLGYSAEVLSNNIASLRIDPREIDAAVLSHGHLDHYGGFPGLFSSPVAHTPALPLIVGGEETFCERVALTGSPPPVMGTLDRTELLAAGFQVEVRRDPATVGDHAFTTGVIPLQGFERAAIPTQMRPGVGCELSRLSKDKQRPGQIPDDGEHELATCFAVRDLGLVVIASCSHRGVINSVRRAQALSGLRKVHAVIGGFHLVRPRTEQEARQTVEEFVQINPDYIIPMHCTGEIFIEEALRRMPEKVVRPYVGDKLIFAR